MKERVRVAGRVLEDVPSGDQQAVDPLARREVRRAGINRGEHARDPVAEKVRALLVYCREEVGCPMPRVNHVPAPGAGIAARRSERRRRFPVLCAGDVDKLVQFRADSLGAAGEQDEARLRAVVFV